MLYPRDILTKIKKVIPGEEFIVLTGARQTGKTSLLLILKNLLEEKGNHCQYLNLENPDYLRSLNKHPFHIFDLIPDVKLKQDVFIDEIQYLDDPSNFLKLLYDEKRGRVRIIASGSSAFYIDKKFKDSLAGRKFLFEISTLNFDEFLIFSREEELIAQRNKKLSIYYREKLLKLWKEYLVYGGYPRVVLAESDDMKKMILEETGSSYIKKDITDAGIRNADKYFSLLKILAGQTGALVNSQELANVLVMARKTVEEYLYVMQKSYHAAGIRPFYRNLRKELTKMPKVYFYDPGLRNFFLNNYEPLDRRVDKGAYVENIAFKEFLRETGNTDKIRFWRTQDRKEVDFIVDNRAFEVKFDLTGVKKKKYERFRKQYPEIEFSFLAYNDILKKFYRWEI